jgi:hypothetical protein
VIVLVIEDQAHFDRVVDFAKTRNLYDGDQSKALKSKLDYLERYGGEQAERTRVRLFRDFAPNSFGFVIERRVGEEWQHLFTGGLLFHGAHDGNGDGSSPTFATTLSPVTGWSIHT